jgi:hypothetical protein
MRYLRNSAIVTAIFLAIGGLTVFVPLPDGWGFLPIFILVAMLASFFVASFLAIPEKYTDSILAATLCFISSVALSVFVVLATMTMVVAVHGCS